MSLTLVSSLIDQQTLEPLAPSPQRQAFWESTTSMPFVAPLTVDHSDTVQAPVTCPFCLTPNHLVNWVAANERGFAQPNFEYRCESCRQLFTRKNIGIERFAVEVAKKRAGLKVYLS